MRATASARGPSGPRVYDPARNALTAEQRSAVTHGAGALLVFAGPGSGKTRTLTARIAHLLDSGRARPQEILALTFTVRAADEMRVRLVALVGHDRAAGVTVATFHALCARLLRPHAHLFGRSSAFSIYDQSDLARIVRDLLDDDPRAAGEPEGELAGSVVEQIALAKSRLAHTGQPCAPMKDAATARGWRRCGNASTPSSSAATRLTSPTSSRTACGCCASIPRSASATAGAGATSSSTSFRTPTPRSSRCSRRSADPAAARRRDR